MLTQNIKGIYFKNGYYVVDKVYRGKHITTKCKNEKDAINFLESKIKEIDFGVPKKVV